MPDSPRGLEGSPEESEEPEHGGLDEFVDDGLEFGARVGLLIVVLLALGRWLA